MFPNLFEHSDDFTISSKRQKEMKEHMQKRVADAVHLLFLPQKKASSVFSSNIEQIITIPTITSHLCSLEAKGLHKLVANSHFLAAFVQACVFYGESEMSASLKNDLMPILLGVYARYYGIPYMKQSEYRFLLDVKQFNPKNSIELKERNEFLDFVRKSADHVATTSAKRFADVLNSKKLNKGIKGVIHIVRYSTRLMGRTASKFDSKKEADVHLFASYTAVLHSVCSAALSTDKKLCVILAEEWERNRKHHKHQAMQNTSRYNHYAIIDLLAAHRCHLLDFFQGREETVIYSEAERMFVRKVDRESNGGYWACFKSKRQFNFTERENKGDSASRNAKLDPPDSELEPVFSMRKNKL
jgi:hypothetical protein